MLFHTLASRRRYFKVMKEVVLDAPRLGVGIRYSVFGWAIAQWIGSPCTLGLSEDDDCNAL